MTSIGDVTFVVPVVLILGLMQFFAARKYSNGNGNIRHIEDCLKTLTGLANEQSVSNAKQETYLKDIVAELRLFRKNGGK